MLNLPPNSEGRLIAQIDRDFEDIVPIFLANRQKDIHTLQQALTDADFATLQLLGHRMKGDGGGYGFPQISEIGAAMEQAAEQRDPRAFEHLIAQLQDFLNRVHVVYI